MNYSTFKMAFGWLVPIVSSMQRKIFVLQQNEQPCYIEFNFSNLFSKKVYSFNFVKQTKEQ